MVESRRGHVIAALAAFDRAIALSPRYLQAFEEKVDLLVRLRHDRDAVHVIDRALNVDPQSVPYHLRRGQLLAGLGERILQAQNDADTCVAADPRPMILYEAACIYAQTAQGRREYNRAVELMARALRAGYRNSKMARDTRLNRIRQDPRFLSLVQAADFIDALAP
jgi:tetratricopeptide (TPR) repeat protein